MRTAPPDLRATGLRQVEWGWSALVSAAWLSAGLAAVLALTARVHFTWSGTPGVHSWVNQHQVPIQQQVFWFYAVTLGVPLVVVLGHALWAGATSILVWSGASRRTALRVSAVCHLPLLGVWEVLCDLQPDESLHALVVATLSALLMLGVCAAVLRFRGRSDAREVPSGPDAVATGGASPAPPTGARRIARTLSLALVLGVFPLILYQLGFDPRLDGEVDLFHEGEFLVPLHEVLRGGFPYRDFYLQHGFLHDLGIPWLGATLFAPSLAGVRWMRALVAPLGLVGAYSLVVALTRARVFPALLFLLAAAASPVGVKDRAFFGLCSIAMLALSLRTDTGLALRLDAFGERASGGLRPSLDVLRCGWTLVASGALAAAALLHSVEVGLYTLATAVVFLAVLGLCRRASSLGSRLLPLGCFVLGAMLVGIPFVVWLLAHGALGDFASNLFVQTRYQLEVWGTAYPSFFKNFHQLAAGPDHAPLSTWWMTGKVWWFYSPILLTLSAAWLAHRALRGRLRSSSTDTALLLLTLAASFFFRSTLGRPDSEHVHYGILFPLLLLVFVVAAFARDGWGRLRDRPAHWSQRLGAAASLLAAAGLSVLLLAWADQAPGPRHGFEDAWAKLSGRYASLPGIRRFDASLTTQDLVPAAQWESIDAVSRLLATLSAPTDRIFDFSNEAGILFFADRRSASRYFQIAYAALPQMQQEIIDELEARQTPIVLYKSKGLLVHMDGIANTVRYPLVADYLNSHYRVAQRVGQLEIWKRDAGRP